jgi:hypothetical protein
MFIIYLHTLRKVKIFFVALLTHINYFNTKSRDSSVGIAQGYGLDGRDSRVRFPAGAGKFSLHHRVKTGSEAPSLLSNGHRGLSSRGEGNMTTHLNLVPRLRMRGAIPRLPQ